MPPRFSGRAAIVAHAARGMVFAFALVREGCDLQVCDGLESLPDKTPYPKATRANLGV